MSQRAGKLFLCSWMVIGGLSQFRQDMQPFPQMDKPPLPGGDQTTGLTRSGELSQWDSCFESLRYLGDK